MEKVKVEKYFKRIGLEMPETIVPDGQLLKKLHFAHCTTVPYENLDIIRGIPLRLDDEGLYQKVVEEGKGGYCFELNGLYAWLLEKVGFTEEPQLDMDFVMPCVFCDEHPDSPINKYEKISVFTADSNIRLWDGEYQIFTHGEKKARPVCGEERQEILRHEFGIFTE